MAYLDGAELGTDPKGPLFRTSTGVCAQVTTCRGPHTDATGLTGTTWPVTSQSNRWRIAASRASIHAATCTGCTAASDGTPPLAHQARNSSAARA